MKIKIKKTYNDYWHYDIVKYHYTKETYDYIFKYLDFDKLDKDWAIYFNNKQIKNWFYKTYTNNDRLSKIHNQSPEGYQWLKENWGNGIFEILVLYQDKQELKTIVNRVINIKLLTKE